MTTSSTRTAWMLALILLSAALVRIQTERVAKQVFDEERYARLARGISFSPGSRDPPLRGTNHPALAVYIVRLSTQLFGTTVRGTRILHMTAGLLTILVVFLAARDWFEDGAALWAAGLFAFNEYHLDVATRATSHAPFLLFTSLAVLAFSRFLRTQRASRLYAAATAVALAFYCKEIAALLLPAFGLILLLPANRGWLRNRHPYLACSFLALLLAPDLAWNVVHLGATDNVTYADHLSRIGGPGLSPHPLAFYCRDAVRWLYPRVTGEGFFDALVEYRSTNAISGILLLVAGALGFTQARSEPGPRLFGIVFALIFGFFSLMTPGRPSKELDSVSWAWVDMTLFPAVILAGAWLGAPADRARRIGRGLTIAGLAWGLWRNFAIAPP